MPSLGPGQIAFTEARTSSCATTRSTRGTILTLGRLRRSNAISLEEPSAAQSSKIERSSLRTTKAYGNRKGLPQLRRFYLRTRVKGYCLTARLFRSIQPPQLTSHSFIYRLRPRYREFRDLT